MFSNSLGTPMSNCCSSIIIRTNCEKNLMKNKKISLQPAFVLHTRLYRETSLLINVLTMEYGKISLVARGVRNKNSTQHTILQPLIPLLISYSGRTTLYTLQQVETNGPGYHLKEKMLLSTLYLNELLIKLLPDEEPHDSIFIYYKNTLEKLTHTTNLAMELRLFEKQLLKALGYGIELTKTILNETIEPQKYYTYQFGYGFSNAPYNTSECFAGSSLLAFADEKLKTEDDMKNAKRLTRIILTSLLNHRPLRSRELFYVPQ